MFCVSICQHSLLGRDFSKRTDWRVGVFCYRDCIIIVSKRIHKVVRSYPTRRKIENLDFGVMRLCVDVAHHCPIVSLGEDTLNASASVLVNASTHLPIYSLTRFL